MLQTAHNLTEGNTPRTLVRFAVPYLAASFLQAMYGAVDTLIVSYYGDAAALSATSNGAQALMTVMCLIMGLTMGGTIMIGQFFGAKQEQAVKESITTIFSFFTLLSFVLSLFMMVLSPYITTWMQTPTEAVNQTFWYIIIGSAGLVFTFGYFTVCAVLRGFGDSKNPLKFIGIACILNIFLDLLFVGKFGWQAPGASLATILAQGVSMLLAIRFMKTHFPGLQFNFKSAKIHIDKMILLLKLGMPIAASQFLVMLSLLIMVILVNRMGLIASAAIGIVSKIDGFSFLPPMAFSSAISVMVAQNIGAKSFRRARETFFWGFLCSLVFGLPIAAVFYFEPEMLMRLTTHNPDIVAAGTSYLEAFSIDCLIMCLMFSIIGFLNGTGHTTFTLFQNAVLSTPIRIFLIWKATDLFGVGLAFPVASTATALAGLLYFMTGLWKRTLIQKGDKK